MPNISVGTHKAGIDADNCRIDLLRINKLLAQLADKAMQWLRQTLETPAERCAVRGKSRGPRGRARLAVLGGACAAS